MSKENALFPVVKDDIAFDTLWQQATATIDALSGDIWTDTGEGDPGITLLQSACWNSSDLSYRLSLSLNDLLTRAGEATLFPAEFGPQDVLTCNTVTAEDYRRALLDLHSSDTAVAGDKGDFLFSDAQLVKEPEASRYEWWYDAEKRTYSFKKPEDATSVSTELKLRGNYWLYLVPSRFTQALSSANRTLVNSYLEDFLTNHRNLAEYVTKIIWLQPVTFSPEITVELDDDVSDINQVVAQIYQAASELLLPSASHKTTQQMRDLGYSNEVIFEGPFLQHGWQQSSVPLISDNGIVVNLSPLINRLLAVHGISAISQLSLPTLPSQITAVSGDNWSWQVTSGYFPQLWGDDPLTLLASDSSPLTLIAKGGIYQQPDSEKVASYLTSPELIQTAPVLLPAGQLRKLAAYTPIGDRLPECYQLQQPNEVIDDTVRELHQFLLPADQQLADVSAELALLPDLLSFNERGNAVRGTQWPYASSSVNQSVHKQYIAALTSLEQKDAAIFPDATSSTPDMASFSRELDFLQYLLGYFGTNRAARPLTLDLADFLATQRAYLAQQPSLGYDRVNIRIDKVSALQKRIAARIGLNSECFADNPDLGKLPFYLIEHRQLLPQLPDETYNPEQTPTDFISHTKPMVTIKQEGSAGKIRQGQLVDLIAIEGDSRLIVAQQLVTATDGDSFTLNTANSQQLQNDLERVQTAWNARKLTWQNSNIWLQDMDYRLNYAASQPADTSERLLSSSDQTPYPSMVTVGDKIIITPAGLLPQLAGQKVKAASRAGDDWQLIATIEAVDQVAGTLLIKKVSGNDFPATADAWRYKWNFSESAYATTDRFSFAVSIVHDRTLIENKNIVPDKLVAWLLQTIMAEFPAHISLINHWLSASAYKNFAATYKRWQNNGNPLGDDAYAIMQMLTLGQLPVTQLGIGLMRIATEAQRTEVIGSDGSEWHTDVILSEELLYVPQDMAAVK